MVRKPAGIDKVIIIGSGFSGLSAACYMAKRGRNVTVYEKNSDLGGRAGQLKALGFTFDTGPTFYWMPDIFENFFNDFAKLPSDYYNLIRLNPGYRVFFGKGESIELPSDFEKIVDVFETIETGSGVFLKKFIKNAGFNYKVAVDKVIYKPGVSPFELVTPDTIKRLPQFIHSLSKTVRSHIKNPMLRQILEFPVLFLGAKPSDITAFINSKNIIWKGRNISTIS